MPLEIVFLKGCPLLNFFVDIRIQDIFLRAGVIH